MYTFYDRYLDTNGYILVYLPTHPRSMSSGSFAGYVYEHILLAEQMLGRPLFTGEVVHHLDLNRSNNSPDNLLVLYGSMHGKLHGWMNKHTIVPLPHHQVRLDLGCIRCKVCQTPIEYGYIYCSDNCKFSQQTKYKRPSREELQRLIWEKPTTHLAKELGVSDKAIEKLCKQLDIQKPPRGYWTKLTSSDIDRYELIAEDDCMKMVLS